MKTRLRFKKLDNKLKTDDFFVNGELRRLELYPNESKMILVNSNTEEDMDVMEWSEGIDVASLKVLAKVLLKGFGVQFKDEVRKKS
jgi:hypothetical protein